MRRKWKQSVNFDSMASDAELDEAYLDELEQQVGGRNFIKMRQKVEVCSPSFALTVVAQAE